MALGDLGSEGVSGGTPRQVSDIDSHRMLVRARQGRGSKNRFVSRAPGSWSGYGSTGSASVALPTIAPSMRCATPM